MRRTEQSLAAILLIFLLCAVLAGPASATYLAPAPASAGIVAADRCDPTVRYGQVYGVVPFAAVDTTSSPVTECPGTTIRVVAHYADGHDEGWTCLVGDNSPGCHYSYSNGVFTETATASTFGTAYGLQVRVCPAATSPNCQATKSFSAFG